MHVEPTVAALRSGYDVLLEKPIATTPEGCIEVIDTAAETGHQLHIGHVLRYTRHFQKIQQIIHSRMLGDLTNVDHRENVSWWHMSHSYVRGSWAKSSESSPMILAKCCHDFDLLLWILGRKCEHDRIIIRSIFLAIHNIIILKNIYHSEIIILPLLSLLPVLQRILFICPWSSRLWVSAKCYIHFFKKAVHPVPEV